MSLQFEWDALKAKSNLKKHGVSFEEAATVFGDLLSRTIPDSIHSEEEERLITIGESSSGQIMVVAHLEKDDKIRIISARIATKREKKDYEER